MISYDYNREKGPYTPAGDLEDESNINEIIMEEYDSDIIDDDNSDINDEIEEEDDDYYNDDVNEDDEPIDDDEDFGLENEYN